MSLSDYLPDFSDPDQMAVFGALGNVLQAGSAPRYDPRGMGITGGSAGNAIAQLLGAGMGGAVGGAQEAQNYQKENIANQVGQLGLQRQQAIQPMQIDMMKQAYGDMSGGGSKAASQSLGSGPGGSMTQADVLGLSALQAARASGDLGKISDAYKTLYEHNPQLAGAVKMAEAQNSVHETPNGPQFGTGGLPGSSPAFGNLAPAATSQIMNGIVGERTPAMSGPGNQQPFEGNVPGSLAGAPNPPPVQSQMVPPSGDALNAYRQSQGMQAPPVDAQRQGMGLPVGTAMPQVPASQLQPPAPRQAAFMPPQAPQAPQPPQAQQLPQPPQGVLASDGKPVVPNADKISFFKPDASGTPSYKTDNTNTGVNQTKEFQKADIPASENIAESASNTQQMIGRLHDIQDAYSKAQAGTLLAQDPDLANKFIAAGVLTDKGSIKDVAQFQRIQGDQALEVLNQLKGAVAGSGNSKILNSEVKNATGKLGDPHLQPEAVASILAVSQGLANYNQDMVKGWSAIGGLGNRVAGGYTMRPTDYSQQFATSHNIDDYIKQAKADMPQVKGTGQVASPKITYVRVNGHLVAQ